MAHFKKLFVASGLILMLSLLLFPGSSLGKDQSTCPVMGGLINKSLYADYQGNRVFFCCPPCLKEFKRDPDKYVKKMKEQGVTPTKSPDPAS
jgi:YHS domain-containing protein